MTNLKLATLDGKEKTVIPVDDVRIGQAGLRFDYASHQRLPRGVDLCPLS